MHWCSDCTTNTTDDACGGNREAHLQHQQADDAPHQSTTGTDHHAPHRLERKGQDPRDHHVLHVHWHLRQSQRLVVRSGSAVLVDICCLGQCFVLEWPTMSGVLCCLVGLLGWLAWLKLICCCCCCSDCWGCGLAVGCCNTQASWQYQLPTIS
jgi:hypothetical protein